MNQRQWFHGHLEGQYVGHPQAASEQASSIGGEHFRIEVTRAAINAIELIAQTTDPLSQEHPSEEHLDEEERSTESSRSQAHDSPSAAPSLEVDYHHEAQGSVLHQEVIPHAFFLEAMGPGKTVRGAAYDVLVSELSFSHPAKHDGKSYGRICGTVSGWFRPLPTPEPVTEVEPPERPREVWRSEVLDLAASTSPAAVASASLPDSNQKDAGADSSSHGHTAPKSEDNDLGPEAEALQEAANSHHGSTDWPFFTAGTLLAVALFLVSGTAAAGIWYGCFLPALGLRRWLYEVVPDGWFVRSFGIVLMTAQLLTAALIIASWQESGCKSLGPFSLFFLGGSLFISCLLPRAPSFAVAAMCLAAVLGQFFGPLGDFCP